MPNSYQVSFFAPCSLLWLKTMEYIGALTLLLSPFFGSFLLVPFLLFSWQTMDMLHNIVDCSNIKIVDWNKSDEEKNEYIMQVNI